MPEPIDTSPMISWLPVTPLKKEAPLHPADEGRHLSSQQPQDKMEILVKQGSREVGQTLGRQRDFVGRAILSWSLSSYFVADLRMSGTTVFVGRRVLLYSRWYVVASGFVVRGSFARTIGACQCRPLRLHCARCYGTRVTRRALILQCTASSSHSSTRNINEPGVQPLLRTTIVTTPCTRMMSGN
ncbi:hypothetical protein KCU88_g52, partial [Aureobasidium melanogenum]